MKFLSVALLACLLVSVLAGCSLFSTEPDETQGTSNGTVETVDSTPTGETNDSGSSTTDTQQKPTPQETTEPPTYEIEETPVDPSDSGLGSESDTDVNFGVLH